MRNEKKYNKSIYFTMVFVQTIIHLVVLSEIFLKLFLIDHIVYDASSKIIIMDFIWIIILFLLENILHIFKQAAKIWITKQYKDVMPEKIMHVCQKLSLQFLEQQNIQEIIKRSDSYFEKSLEYTDALVSWLRLDLSSIVLVWFMRNTSFFAILVMSILVLVAFVINLRTTKNTFGFWKRYMETARRFNYLSDLQIKREYAYERRIYDTSKAMDERFSKEFDQAARINRKSGHTRFRGQILLESILIGITVFVMFYFALPNTMESITLGTYTAITETIARMLEELSRCAESVFPIREFHGLRTELIRFVENDFLEKGSANNFRAESPRENVLSLDNLQFRYYENNEDTLKGICFTFEKGKHYGLVGVNGAGKTTLAKLLLDLYKPTNGRIYDGTEKKTALFQDFQVYPVTVREYLLMGNDSNLSNARVSEVLDMLECSNLKQGLDTPLTLLTEEGTLLSKGQLQRLAIARAFLSEADFILLDEPTASLDPISEREVYRLSEHIFQEKTTLFITHRLGAVSQMDEILVLDHGQLVEHGCHEELMRKNGVYRKLYQTQKEMYVDEI